MKLRVMRWLTRLALKYKWYYRWSRIYRWLWERKHDGTRLPSFHSIHILEDTVGSMCWRKDTWLMLWDAVSTPQAAWARHLNGRKAGDCDDISIFAAVCMVDMRDKGYLPTVAGIWLLSVPWMDYNRKVGGHNVCAYRYVEKGEVRFGHISNWYDGERCEGFQSLREVVLSILGLRTSMGWALANPETLALVEYGEGSDFEKLRKRR